MNQLNKVKISIISVCLMILLFCGFSPHILADEFGDLGLGNVGSDLYSKLPQGDVDPNQAMIAGQDTMGVSDVQVQNYRLSGRGSHSPSNLLPSVLFSQAGDTLDSAKLSLRDLSLYPAPDDENEAYGNLTNPKSLLRDEKPQKVGVETANYIKTLYDYEWLVPYPKDSNVPILGAFSKLFKDGKKALQSVAMGWALRFAYVGAFIFDVFTNIISVLAKWADGLNIPAALGFVSDDNALNNALNSIILKTLHAFGISPTFLRLVKGFVWMIMLASFVMMIVIGLANPKSGKNSPLTRLKRLAIRVLVIILTIPLSVQLKLIVDGMTKNITQDFKSDEVFNNHYVVDTLSWAATMNLSLSAINPSATNDTLYNGGQLFANDRSSPFAPTNENVKNLASTTMAKMSLISKYQDVTNAVDGTEIKSANKMKSYQALGQALSADVVSVNDYLNVIGGLPDNGDQGSQVAAKNFPRLNNPVDVGPAYKGDYLGRYRPAYFLMENPNKSDSFDANIKYGDEIPAGTAYQALHWVPIGVNSSMFPFSAGSPMKMIPVTWNEPKSYIYSAALATEASDQSTSISNFTNGAGTYQNNNPRTGEDLDADQSDPAVSKADLYTNSASIAIANKYAGIANVNGGGIQSLSTQSVAMLLQANYDKSSQTLTFNGFNTIPTDKGKGKVTSKNGNQFYRYTIPNSGAGDLAVRIGQLNTIWVISALCAVTAFIYLLKAPIFSSILKMIGAFISALFTGNLPALLEYLAYYGALKLSFAFALIGCYFGSIIGNTFMNFINTSSGGLIGLFGTIDVLGFAMILFALAIGIALTWPSISLQIGRGTKKTSILGAIVMFPYVLAEAADEYLDQYNRVLYGKGKNQTFARKMANQVRTSQHGSGFGKALVKAGVQAGAAVATGGASLATAGASGAMALMNLKKSQQNEGINPLDAMRTVAGTALSDPNKNPLSDATRALLTGEDYDASFKGTSLFESDDEIKAKLQAQAASLGKLPDKIDDDDILRYKADQLAKFRPQAPDEDPEAQNQYQEDFEDAHETSQSAQEEVLENQQRANEQAAKNAQQAQRPDDQAKQTQDTTSEAQQRSEQNAAKSPNDQSDVVDELRKLNDNLVAMMNGNQMSSDQSYASSQANTQVNQERMYETSAPVQTNKPNTSELNSKMGQAASNQSYFRPDEVEETQRLQARRQLLTMAEARRNEIAKIDQFMKSESAKGANADQAKLKQLTDARSALANQVAKIETKIKLDDNVKEVKAKIAESPRVKATLDLGKAGVNAITKGQSAELAKSMSKQLFKNVTGVDAKEFTPEGIRQANALSGSGSGNGNAMTKDDVAEMIDALRDNTKAVEDVAAAQDRYFDK